MNYNKNICLLDWDDTLFPTSWFINNKNNINEKYFYKIDNYISFLLREILKYSNCVIVSNANMKWIMYCLRLLPTTNKIINNNIQIISTVDCFDNVNITKRKNNVFFNIIYKFNIKNKMLYLEEKYKNILVIGDDVFEYNATKLIYKYSKNNIIKYIAMINNNNNILYFFDQMELLTNQIYFFFKNKSNMDVQFISIDIFH
jgi:hypothetical protein